MLNTGTEDFWRKEQIKSLQDLKSQTEKYFEHRTKTWQSLIIVVATVLGFSLGISNVMGGAINVFIIITWVLQIVIILTGFFLLIIDNESRHRREIASYKYKYNMNEISIKEAKGEFNANKELKTGLLVAAMDNLNRESWDDKSSQLRWTEKSRGLIKKYKNKLPTAEIFKDIDKENKTQRILRSLMIWSNKHINKISVAFYFLIIISFVFLLLSIII